MLKVKTIIKRAVAAAVTVCILTAAVFAGGTGTVNVSTYLNVRSSASTSAAIVGKLYNGTQVSLIDSSNGWYKISYNGLTGWVYGSYLTITTADTNIQKVIDTANSMIGVKYVFGGTSPTTGFDCSGLTMYCYAKAGITLPHSSAQQATMGIAVSRANLKPGDLIFFSINGNGIINHVGIYIGNNNFINAQSGAGVVKQASLTTSYWSNAYITARRLIY